MSDIVERLRKGIEWTGPTQDDTGQTENLMDEAADEIERLREWNREIALNAREFVAENEKLRAALKMARPFIGWAGYYPTILAEVDAALEGPQDRMAKPIEEK